METSWRLPAKGPDPGAGQVSARSGLCDEASEKRQGRDDLSGRWHAENHRARARPADLTQGLQLASGVAFVCMLFAGTAAAGAAALMLHFSNVPAPPVSVDRVLTSVGYGLVFVYGVRVAGMFAITTTTLAQRAGLMPRWLAVLSYLMAAFLLVTTTTQPATLLVYPAWVLILSFALVRSARTRAGPTLAAEVLRE
jgi:hypothetical protein